MPEQLTKHPDVTLQVLRSAGARCGEGVPQKILTACPAARFCQLPGGELCVYGLADAPAMTQISAAEWAALHRATAPGGAGAADAVAIGPVAAAAGVALAVGLLLGAVLSWRRRR